jgi:hypothetical protein
MLLLAELRYMMCTGKKPPAELRLPDSWRQPAALLAADRVSLLLEGK